MVGLIKLEAFFHFLTTHEIKAPTLEMLMMLKCLFLLPKNDSDQKDFDFEAEHEKSWHVTAIKVLKNTSAQSLKNYSFNSYF